MEELHKEMKTVCDSIKDLKKKRNITKRSSKEAIMRHIIHEVTGRYIHFYHENSSTKNDVGEMFNLLMKRAYWQGRITERMSQDKKCK